MSATPRTSSNETVTVPSEARLVEGHAEQEIVRGATIGRYFVLGKLGEGGMGVVFAAYDQELDRKVALKLLHPGAHDGDAARLRMLREAQALAKVSHPAIVAVHDVGTVGDRVWIAMEFVAGTTLRRWAAESPRSWHEVLAVIITAGRGLAAAHAAGLAHRDFKPDNVMIGERRTDGTPAAVRVMDFGLARAVGDDPTQPHDPVFVTTPMPRVAALRGDLTQGGAVPGTPAYMAVEQLAGAAADQRSDQFAFCVTTWELLFGERPFAGDNPVVMAAQMIDGRIRTPSKRGIPPWVRRILERGLASDPTKRWPSVAALIDALERGRAAAGTRRVVLGLGAIGVAIAAALLVQRVDLARRHSACERDGAEITAVWNDDTRAQLRAALLATGVSYASETADRVLPRLDEHAQAWQLARSEVCVEHDVRGSWDDDTYDRATWCLDERRAALTALVGELLIADASAVQRATLATGDLVDSAPCLDADRLRRLPPPPNEQRAQVDEVRAELSRVDALSRTGKYADGLVAARSALARANELGWPALVAAAQLREGLAIEETGDDDAAERVLARAYFDAARVGAWDTAAEASIRLVSLVGSRRARAAEGRTWAEHAAMVLAHAGDTDGLREAARIGSLGEIAFATGEYLDASGLLERALAIRERVLGPDHPVTGRSAESLAMAETGLGDYERALPLSVRAVAVLETALGPDHPDVADAIFNLALIHGSRGDFARARELHERALAINERAYGPDHPNVARSASVLGLMLVEQGELEAARALELRALAIHERMPGPPRPDTALVLTNLAHVDLALGEHARAKPVILRALAIAEQTLGPDHPLVPTLLTSLAEASLATGDATGARDQAERALAAFEAREGIDENEYLAMFMLAKTLVATGDRSGRPRELALRARDGWRAAGMSSSRSLAELDALLAGLGE